MIRYTSSKQQKIEEFKTDFEMTLDPRNRWIQLSSITPWDDLVREYIKSLNPNFGAPGIDTRVAVGSLIIKHKMTVRNVSQVHVFRLKAKCVRITIASK